VAFRAANVDTKSHTNTMKPSYGINNSTALLMPKSPFWPIYSHDRILFGGKTGPIETKATKQYITTTSASEMKIALGIFLFGFLTYSPV
jgi:hypothetical protein